MLQLLTQMVFFGVMHVVLQLCSIVLYDKNGAYLHLEKPKLQDLFLSKTNSNLSLGNKMPHVISSNIDGFLWRDTCVSLTQLNRPIATTRTHRHTEKPKFQEVFFSKTNSILRESICKMLLLIIHMVFF
jgi:hypothetical protein